MKSLSKIRALVVDHGLFVPFAQALSRHFDEVMYYADWSSDLFPIPNRAMIGEGIGLTRVHDLFKAIKECDLVVLPDVFQADLLEHCRELGKPCWGAGVSDEFELDRWYAKEYLRKAGLPYNPTAQLKGVSALRKYIERNPNKVVKLSRYRGVSETFRYESYEQIQPKIDEIAYKLGPFQEMMKFYVEDVIDSLTEPGIDSICVDGQYPKNTILGYEVKDKSYIGCVMPYDSMFPGLRAINDALSSVFKRDKYRGFFSTEARVSKDHKTYPIDLTCRHASPAGEPQHELIKNLGETVWSAAHGILVEPVYTGKYAAQVMLTSGWAERDFQPIFFPEKISQFVKLYNACSVDGQVYIIPQDAAHLKEIGSVVGVGDTLQGAIDKCKEYAEQVTGYLVDCDSKDLDEAAEVVEAGEKVGVRFGAERKLKVA